MFGVWIIYSEGGLIQGQTLTVQSGYNNHNYSPEYQWMADGVVISNSNFNHLFLDQTLVGKGISVTVNYFDDSATSNSYYVANINDLPTGYLSIKGYPVLGQTLTATKNTLSDPDGLGTLSYQWKAGGVNITGATGSSLVLEQAQVGKVISVTANYIDGYDTPESASSDSTKSVRSIGINSASTGQVAINGIATQGQTLSATNTLADVDGLGSISYQWKADGVDISGATGSLLVLGQTHVGKVISVTANYIDYYGTAESVNSANATLAVKNVNDNPTGFVIIEDHPYIPNTIPSPIIKSSTVGTTLFVYLNSVNDIDGIGTISYQWKANGNDTLGVAGNSLLLDQSLLGKTISVNAIYTDGYGKNESISSYNVLTIESPPLPLLAVSAFSPTDAATDIALGNNIVLTFNREIQRGTGTIYLRSGSSTGMVVESFDATTSSRLSISGSTLTIDPTIDFSSKANYYVTFSAGTVKDLMGNAYSGTNTYDFSTVFVDTTAPWVSNFNPADASTSVAVDSNIVLTFSEAIKKGTGTIYLTLGSTNGVIVESFDVATSPRLIISDSALTIDPTSDLASNTNYYVTFSTGTVKDLAGNAYQGTNTYDFTTLDNTAPIVNTFSPTDGATGVAVGINIVLTFSEVIQKGTGYIYLRSGPPNGRTIEYIDVATSSAVKISGSTLTINPTDDLSVSTKYFLILSSGNVKDLAGNAYEGASTYDFMTRDTIGLKLSFNQASSSGNYLVFDLSDQSNLYDYRGISVYTKSGVQFPISKNFSAVNIQNNQLVISLDAWLVSGDNYDLKIPANTIKDVYGNWMNAVVMPFQLDTLAPDFQSAVTSSNGLTVTLTYSEALNSSTANASAFAVKAAGINVTVSSVAIIGNAVVLSLVSAIERGQSVTVAYTDSTTGNDLNAVQDAIGNDAVSLGVTTVTNNSTVDTIVPVFQSAVTSSNGLTVILTYNEALSISTAVVSAFAVKVAGTDVIVTSVAVSSNTVVLSLATAIQKGQTVTVAYTDATAGNDLNAVQDTAGNDALTLSNNTVVTNYSSLFVNSSPSGSVIVLGSATQNQILTASNTLADVDGLGAISYQWLSNGSVITNANQSSYQLTQADTGKVISVKASYTDLLGTAESVTSSQTNTVASKTNSLPTGSVNIFGTVTQNQTLSASNNLADADGLGTISYQWLRNGAAISNANQSTYLLDQVDVGKVISFKASYTDLKGTNESLISQSTSNVANANDLPTGNVNISGTATQNQILTASNNLADADGLRTISYQWLSNGSVISNANQATYTLTQADVGKVISVKASYTDLLGTAESVTSSPTNLIASKINSLPTGSVNISGSATQNQILTASNNLADADGLRTISYQWLSNGSVISNANQSTYTLTQADIGKVISVKASYTDLLGTAESVMSSQTNAVAAKANSLPTGSVNISGTATQNQKLTASNNLADANGLGAISYQWLSNGSVITNANQSTYTLTQADVGKVISVKASYIDLLGTAESVMSSQTNAVAAKANSLPTGSVNISGTATQNQILTASNTLADVDGLGAISYQWLSNGSVITNANQITYTLTQADVGKVISVKASYTDLLGTAESVTNSQTNTVVSKANLTSTSSVNISGTTTQNQILIIGYSITDLDGMGTLNFQWLSNGSVITNATQTTYTLTQADVGKSISVKASYVDGLGNAESIISTATTNIANVNDAPIGNVTINGTTTKNQILTASNTLTDADGIGTITYQWLSNGVAIPNANQSSYQLTQADTGQNISVKASYTDLQNTAESVTSSNLPINKNNAPTGSVTIKGLATWGTTISVTSTIKDADGIGKLSYSWQSDNGELSTSPTYTLAESDVDTKVWLTVSYTDKKGCLEEEDSKTVDVTISTKPSAANDILTGTDKADKLSGLAGNDRLIGDAGSDKLTGGKGIDTFSFSSSDFYTENAKGDSVFNKSADKITDFNLKEHDALEFGDLGELSFYSKLADAKEDNAHLFYVKGSGSIYLNTSTTDGFTPTVIITLTGKPALNADGTDWNYPA